VRQAIATVLLQALESGAFCHATLFRGIDQDGLRDIEEHWKPMFDAAAPENRPEDAHWEWADKVLRAQTKPLNCEIFGIEADNKTQGMMLVIKLGRQCFSRHQEHPGAPLVYIDFLATAPWNRPSMGDAPAYKGVGVTLFM